MLTPRDAAIRLLKLMMVASLVLPAVLFVFAGWINYRNFQHVTDERINRSLDILHEHALKVLQTVQVAFDEIDAIINGMPDDEIQRNEGRLHDRLARIVATLPQLQGIVIIDREGRPLVASNVLPAPTNVNLANRDYFTAQVSKDAGTYVSGIHAPRMGGLDTSFFAMSQRRRSPDGKFNGVISIALVPGYFEDFYSKMSAYEGNYFALARQDGTFLARVPALEKPAKLDDRSEFRQGVARGLDRYIYSVDSQIDLVDRRIGYRKLAGFPLYVLAGVEHSTVVGEWVGYMSSHLIYGGPATACLFFVLALALRRTRRLYEEADRREVAEGAIRQAERLTALGQLTGGVAHDFNNLLMVISGSAERLRGELTDKKHTRLLDMIRTATQRGEALTRQLLTYSRQQTLSPQVIDLSRRLPQIREVLTRSLTDIDITVEAPETGCAVRVDPGEFELAILNLAINAKDAMPQGGTLSIRVKPVTLRGEASEEGLSGEFVAVRLADTGHGIAAGVLSRVFEPFFTTKEVGKGTGLGLSQVYGFAKQSGGTATITSAEGTGTVVTVYLPRSDDQPSQQAPPAQAPVQAQDAGTVLLVEDNSDVAEVAAGYLGRLGYHVRSVAHVEGAIAALALDPKVDLVFSDILMPGGRSGFDLARELRKRFPNIPVLLTTGYSASAQDAVRQGMVVLQKPYDLEALRRHIAEARDNTKARMPEPAK